MEDVQEQLRNIDVFCKVLVKKIVENENGLENDIPVEPIENLLRKKYIVEDDSDVSPLTKHLIPLSHVEEPLVDVFEDDEHVRIFMRCSCNGQKITVHTAADGLEICAKECQKLELPVKHLKIENMRLKCNNEVLQIDIPKMKASAMATDTIHKTRQH